MTRSFAAIRAWSSTSLSPEQRQTLLWGIGLTLLNVGVLVFIMVVAASQG